MDDYDVLYPAEPNFNSFLSYLIENSYLKVTVNAKYHTIEYCKKIAYFNHLTFGYHKFTKFLHNCE